MKLAEALVLRADIQKRVEQLRSRLQTSALVQEGDKPDEDPQALLTQLDALLAELESLIVRINRTNLTATLATGVSLTAALAQRDILTLRQSVLKSVADTAAQRTDRYSQTEIRKIATVDVGALRQQVDDVARDRRELDTAIQAMNWTTDLVE